MFAGDLPFLLTGLFVNEPGLLHHVAGAEEQHAFTRQPVAARAPGFLVVTLDVFRQVVVDDEPDVRLVDAHAEGDGGADHPHVVAQEKLLVFAALPGCQSGVIRPGLDTVLVEPQRDALRGLARLAIDDAAFPGPRADEFQHLGVGLVFGQDAVGKVRAVEAGDITARLMQLELLDDVGAHAFGGGGGERHHRRFGEKLPQLRDLAVFRPEIVPPLADAMRLVHGQQAHVPALQIREEPRQHQPLRRDIEQAELAIVQAAQPRPRLGLGNRGIEKGRRNAAGPHPVHLVLHQRDQRRHDDGEAVARERGKLEAERFAAAGGQQREHVAARQ